MHHHRSTSSWTRYCVTRSEKLTTSRNSRHDQLTYESSLHSCRGFPAIAIRFVSQCSFDRRILILSDIIYGIYDRRESGSIPQWLEKLYVPLRTCTRESRRKVAPPVTSCSYGIFDRKRSWWWRIYFQLASSFRVGLHLWIPRAPLRQQKLRHAAGIHAVHGD